MEEKNMTSSRRSSPQKPHGYSFGKLIFGLIGKKLYGLLMPRQSTLSFCGQRCIYNRLATGDCMSKWSQNIDTSCVFCQCPSETKSHLFFTCPFSAQVWKTLVKGILGTTFSTDCDTLTGILKDPNHDRLKLSVLRYTFHATVYALWRERNIRRHGEPETSPLLMVKYIDKTVEIDCVRLELLGQ